PGGRDHDRPSQGPQEADRDHAVAAGHQPAEAGAARPEQFEGLMSAEYHFITHWTIRGTAREVAEVLGDPLGLARWWPSVYLEVRELDPGDPITHVGRVIDLYTKGWLPYTLRWRFTVTESRGVGGFTLVAEGDFVGTGVWTFEEKDGVTD